MRAGVRFVDPTWPVERVLEELQGASKVICEAMHGAIVADALRTPRIAVTPISHEHRFKWQDWAASLCIPLRQHVLWPSTVREAWAVTTGGQGWGRTSRLIGESRLATLVNFALRRVAAAGLRRLAADRQAYAWLLARNAFKGAAPNWSTLASLARVSWRHVLRLPAGLLPMLDKRRRNAVAIRS